MESAPNVNIIEFVKLSGVITGLLILVLTIVVNRVLAGFLSGLGNRFDDKRLVIHQAATLLRFVVYFIGVLLAVLVSVNLSREVLLAVAGTAAVTIGFGLKDLTASVLAGIIIILDKPFQVGDRVNFAGVYGEIKEIGLRSVRLVTLDDSVVTIPNNKFLTEISTSGNWGELEMLVQLDFYIGVDQNVSLAKKLVGECLTASRYACLKKNWAVLVSEIQMDNTIAVRLRGKAYVLDVQYEKAFETDVTERVLEKFNRYSILPPALLTRTSEKPE